MIAVDTSIVNVALPQIQDSLHLNQSDLTWVVNAYLITFGSLLLTAGRLSDLAGRKRVFLAGLAVFTLASLLCGIAESPGLLIGARFLQGVGAAMQATVILAMIVTEFPKPDERAKAMSAWVVSAVAGGSLGLLVGGVLTQLLDWHWIFFVNIPIGLVVGLAAWVLVPADRGIGFSGGIDWLGSLLVTGALASAVYGFVSPATNGWGAVQTIAPLALAVVLLAAFVWVESRHPNPIFPLRILKLHGLILSSVVRGLLVTAVYGMFFLGTLYLERVLGYGALNIGLAFLPYTLTVAVMSLGVNRRLVARFGTIPVTAVGLVIAAVSLFMLVLAGPDAGFFPFPFLAFLGMGLGIGNAFGPLTVIAMTEVPAQDAGVASGIVNVSQQVAGALGLALLATLATSHTSTLSQAGNGIDDALTGGYHLAFVFGVGALLASLLLVVTILRRHAPGRAPKRMPNGSSGPASRLLDD